MGLPRRLFVSFLDLRGHDSFPLQTSSFHVCLLTLLQLTHITVLSFFIFFFTLFFLQSSFSIPDFFSDFFFILFYYFFLRAMPFTNQFYALLEIELKFTELCSFLSTLTPCCCFFFNTKPFWYFHKQTLQN